MDRGIARFAALALAVLALAALPLAAAQTGVQPTDATGPDVTNVAITPNPVTPDVVYVGAVATDVESNVVRAEFFFDMPGLDGSSFYRMSAADGFWDSTSEGVYWLGTYATFTLTIAPGPHVLYVHAMDILGNWGPFSTASPFVGDPTTIGPTVASLDATPADLSLGADLDLTATILDPFRGQVVAAEYFLDVLGPDGAGTPMAALDGAFGGPGEAVGWTGPLVLAPGNHSVYVHGQNDRLLWGPVARAAFTLRAPSLTLRLLMDAESAAPGQIVTIDVAFENLGNAAATEAWLSVALPPALAYVDDTAATIGGTPTGPTTYQFADVAPGGYAFSIRTQVQETARDGEPLLGTATLDFTNDQAWDFPPMAVVVAATVVAPELGLDVLAPASAHAGEPFDLVLYLNNTGFRAIPTVDVRLSPSTGATIIADNAAGLGGTYLGDGRWRFADFAPSSHRFVVTQLLAADVADDVHFAMDVAASYLSRAGADTEVRGASLVTSSRPVVSISAGAEDADVLIGAEITMTVDVTNEGSAVAASAVVEVALPAGLELVTANPPATRVGAIHRWAFPAVESGGARRVTLVLRASSEIAAALRFELMYTSPNGADLGASAVEQAIAFRAAPLPVLPVVASAALAGTSLALAAFVATERGKTALLFLAVPLYTRLRHEKVLDHETRGMIRGYIVANPGDHYNSIKGALELPNGTLAYHIQVLEKESIVKSVKDGKFRRFYPYDMRLPDGGEPTKIQRVVLDLIRANPGITPRDAAALLGLTSSTVSYHLEKLEELGRIEYRREGITKRLYVQGDLAAP